MQERGNSTPTRTQESGDSTPPTYRAHWNTEHHGSLQQSITAPDPIFGNQER